MTARLTARKIRSGTLVGPGICRKCRPARSVVHFAPGCPFLTNRSYIWHALSTNISFSTFPLQSRQRRLQVQDWGERAMNPTLSACEAAAAIRSGTLTSLDLVQQCIARIEELEDTVRAWTFFDPSYALHQAREADRLQLANVPLGALHGIPVGIKDIFDTSDMPTENGTVLHAGRTPHRRCHRSRTTARRWRRDHGQDRDDRTCGLFPRQDAQSPQSQPYTWRFLEWIRSRRGSRHGPACDRLSDQRLGH